MTEQGPVHGDDRSRGRTPQAPGSRKVVLSALALGAVALVIYGTYIVAVVLRTG